MSTDIHAPSGERIAAEIERELQDRRYPLRHVTLVPAEYHVYLHPEDYSYVESIVPRIAQDVEACLNTLVDRLNKPSAWSRLIAPANHPPIEVPTGGWAIHVKPAVNNDVGRGELGIHSRMAVPRVDQFSGSRTVRISETLISGTERRSTTRMQTEASEALAPVAAQPEQATILPRPVLTSGPRLSYRDDTGEHIYVLTKELTKIGRGGSAHWVDLTVAAGAQVSREHCRIRRDPAGRLFLQDVSSSGTFRNGRLVPRLRDADPAGSESELHDGDTIRLADAITLTIHLV